MKFNLVAKLCEPLIVLSNDLNFYLNTRPNLNRKIGLVFHSEKATQELVQQIYILSNENDQEFGLAKKALVKERELKILICILFVTMCSITYGVLKSDQLIIILIQTFKYFTTLFCFFLYGMIKSHSDLHNVLSNFKPFKKEKYESYSADENLRKNENIYFEKNSKYEIFSNGKIEEIEYIIDEKVNTEIVDVEKLKRKIKVDKQVYEKSAKFYCIIEYYVSKYENKEGFIKFDGNNKAKIAKGLFMKYNQTISLHTFKSKLKGNDSWAFSFMSFNVKGIKKNSELEKLDDTSNYFAENNFNSAKEHFDKDYNLSKLKPKKLLKTRS
jgi:hypothetical protein